MNRQQMEMIYIANGLASYRLYTLEDLLKCHGINARAVNGYKTLTEEHKNAYEGFILKYFNGWGMDYRMNLTPTGIHYVVEKNYCAKHPTEEDCVTSVRTEWNKLIWQEDFLEYREEPYLQWIDKENKDLPIFKVFTKEYLRFDYLEGSKQRKDWLHVMNEGKEWF